MTAALRQHKGPPLLTEAQRRAIFRAMNAKGLDIDDIRAMTPARSISALTVPEASELLDKLNAGTAYQRRRGSGDRQSSGFVPRRPRRSAMTIAMVSQAQRDLICAIRMEIGWTEAQLADWLSKRHYHYDSTRTMDRFDSSADAVAVIELLKQVRDRTLAARWKKTHPEQSVPAQSAMPLDRIQRWTIDDRMARLAKAAGWTKEAASEWVAGLTLASGRGGHAPVNTADASELIERLTAKISEATSRPDSRRPAR